MQARRDLKRPETRQQSQRGNGGIDIEPRGKTGAHQNGQNIVAGHPRQHAKSLQKKRPPRKAAVEFFIPREVTGLIRSQIPRLPAKAQGCTWSSCCAAPTRADGWSE